LLNENEEEVLDVGGKKRNWKTEYQPAIKKEMIVKLPIMVKKKSPDKVSNNRFKKVTNCLYNMMLIEKVLKNFNGCILDEARKFNIEFSFELFKLKDFLQLVVHVGFCFLESRFIGR
jgi:hypothetical protein